MYLRCALVASLMVAVTALTACGTAQGSSRAPNGPTSTRPAGLCDQASELTRLVVHRTDAFPRNHIRFSFPSTAVVSDPAAARTVARAVCGLPTMPRAAIACPADRGIVYQLTFSFPAQKFRAVSMDATGCEEVRGLGAVRWAIDSPRAWHALGAAMGLRHVSQQTFAGKEAGSGDQ